MLYEPPSPPLSGGSGATTPGHHEQFLYNEHGQIIEHRHPDNQDADDTTTQRRRDTFDYSITGYLDGVTIDADEEALFTFYDNDAVGRPEEIIDPNSNSTDIEYDDLDRVEVTEAPALVSAASARPKTTFAYDDNGNLERVRQFWFEADGTPINVAGETDPDSYLATEYTFDTRNRVTAIGREDGTELTVSEIVYDGNGNVIRELSPLAADSTEPDNVVTYEYDVRDLPVRVTRGNTYVTRIDYDKGGRVTRVIEAYGTAEARVSEAEYDELGYLWKQTDAAGLLTTFTRDALGRATRAEASSDGYLLARTDYDYDLVGRLTDVDTIHRDHNGHTVAGSPVQVTMTYTDAGNVLTRSLEGDATTYTYDTAMRRKTVTSPGNNSITLTYDANSNVTTRTESAYDTAAATYTDFITRYGYDELDRVVSVGHDDGDGIDTDAKKTTYAYDSLGQLVTVTDARANVAMPVYETLTHTYDPLGRLDKTTHDPSGIAAVVDYDYDANGRLTEMVDPNTNATTYGYDTFNRLVQTTYADGRIESFTYDALDNVTEHVAPDGLETNVAYDAAGRPVAQTFAQLAGRATPGDTTYDYDALGRITEARTADTTVTHAYDTLGNAVLETITVDGGATLTLPRFHDQKGQFTGLNPHGSTNTLDYGRDAEGKISGVTRAGNQVATFDYLGARPNGREYFNGTSPVGASYTTYEETGLRPDGIDHEDDASATVDTRAYGWDPAYNLDDYTITGGPLSPSSVDYDYDALNRLDTDSPDFDPDWTFDKAGNRTGTGYTQSGQDALMHRYTEVDGDPYYYDAQGALIEVDAAGSTVYEYRYDANGRLVHYRDVTLAATTAFSALDLGDGDWTVVNGSWSVDPIDGYLEETSTDNIGAILYHPSPLPMGFTFKYRSPHDPEDADGDLPENEYSAGDYPPRYYAQVLLAADTSGAPDDYPYLALRIEPDRMTFVHYDGTTVHELDSVAAETVEDIWYTVEVRPTSGGPGGGALSVQRKSPTDGDPVALVLSTPMSEMPAVDRDAIGFTVGEDAEYKFDLVEFTTTLDTNETFVEWTYDAYGRKVAETVYDDTSMLSQTLYQWDGWRLLAEVDGVTGETIAEYVPGPAYVDDIVASFRDLDDDGNFIDANEQRYHLTDQQHSTIALLDTNGDVIERYGYDPFGVATFYEDDGTPLMDGVDPATESAVGNAYLFTGREYLPELGLYDYRQRHYNPTLGRFLTTDPVYDPANLGNSYTYVGNNPGAFVDPFGEERWGAQSYWRESLDVGYGFFIGGPIDVLTGVVSAVVHPIQTAQGVASLAGGLVTDPIGTTGGLAGSFYAQFENSDTAGQATFGAASAVIPGAAGTAKAASATANAGRDMLSTTRAARTAGAAEVAAAGKTALRNRVLANIEASKNARRASELDVHLAIEDIYTNANKAVEIAKEAGLTNRHGALGTRAHKEFARMNAATNERLAGRGIHIEIEPFRDARRFVPPRTKGSLSVDVLVRYRGVDIRGFDLKTGRPWSRTGHLERESRFKVPIQQISIK